MWQNSVQRVKRYRREVIAVLLLLVSAIVLWYLWQNGLAALRQEQAQEQLLNEQVLGAQVAIKKSPPVEPISKQRLSQSLPDNPGFSSFVIEMAHLSVKDSVAIGGITFSGAGASGTATSATATSQSGFNPSAILSSLVHSASTAPSASGSLGVETISMTLTGSADNVLAMIKDMEHGSRMLTIPTVLLPVASGSATTTAQVTCDLYYR